MTYNKGNAMTVTEEIGNHVHMSIQPYPFYPVGPHSMAIPKELDVIYSLFD